MTNEEYARLVRERAKPSPMGKDLAWAFLVGGGISALGQGLLELFLYLGLDRERASNYYMKEALDG